jgi:hypothetical protein
MLKRSVRAAVPLALLTWAVAGGLAQGMEAASGSPVRLLQRGGRVSGVARPEAYGRTRPSRPLATICTTPGAGNYQADCQTQGRAVNETWIATNNGTYVAGANDYNSYNGNADFGYYTSTDAKTWTDNGPLHLFPDGTNHAAGDPGLAIDPQNVVYYSGIFFDYADCTIGGVELARKDPGTGDWSYYQILANSNTQFQDKPAVAIDNQHVFVSWTKHNSCTGVGVTAPIYIAVFPLGPTSVPPIAKLKVPGSTYSSGSSLASDGAGGFWITWEEFPGNSLPGQIMLAHWRQGHGWGPPVQISSAGFQDLPSPLPGFAFRDNSFPVLAMALQQGHLKPVVAWCSADSGRPGRTFLYSGGTATVLSNSGDDQFFPSIGVSGTNIMVSWSQTNRAAATFDQYLYNGGTVSKISTASSFPNQDLFFGGAFIGDYNGMAVSSTFVHPIWTDLRRNDQQYGGKAQDAMVYSP